MRIDGRDMWCGKQGLRFAGQNYTSVQVYIGVYFRVLGKIEMFSSVLIDSRNCECAGKRRSSIQEIPIVAHSLHLATKIDYYKHLKVIKYIDEPIHNIYILRKYD